jgi:hypothetical protein
MSSSLDSVAVFKARLAKMRIGDLFSDLERLGWDTLGSFAFAAGANMNGSSVDDKAFNEHVVIPLFGAEPDPRLAQVRRLHFEAYMQTVGELHRRNAHPETEDKPKTLAAPERAARLEEIGLVLANVLTVKGDLEPSDALVDKLSHMQDGTGVLRYVPLEEVGRRDHEVRGIKKDQYWKTDPVSGTLKMQEVGGEVGADISTDYFFHRTLMRRGVAMHMSHLLHYNLHDSLVRWYMDELHRAAPLGYAQVSIDQIHRVDKEIWIRLADETRGGLQIDMASGNFVLDALLPKIMLEARIVNLLNPHQVAMSSGGRHVSPAPAGIKRGSDDAALQSALAENKRLKQQLQNGGKGNKSKGNKGKGNKGDNPKKSKVKMPTELSGLSSTVDGINGCFDFNMKKGCTNTVDGNGACHRGKHACLRCGSTGHGAASSRCKMAGQHPY